MFQYQKKGVDHDTTPGINGETVAPQGSGDSDYAAQDYQFMRALLNTTGLIATFSGHDHDNDWYDSQSSNPFFKVAYFNRCFKWNGMSDESVSRSQINMCYGRHSGYGGYGDAARGSRQILLHSTTIERELQTWIRLEDGTISAPVHLNSTYGQDKYTPVAGRAAQVSPSSRIDDPSSLLILVQIWIAILIMSHLRAS